MQTLATAARRVSGASWAVTVGVVLLVVLIIAGIAIPNLLRSRVAANEASAVGSLRTINTAIAQYSAQHPGEDYPQQLSDLAPYLDAGLVSGQRSGYSFRLQSLQPDEDSSVAGVRVEAVPLSLGQTGTRLFFTDQTGVISYRRNASEREQPLDGGPAQPADHRSAPPVRRRIQKGSMDLVVAEPAAAAELVRAVAYRLDGYVESARFSDAGAGARQATIAIRVPLVRFDEARRQLRSLGERVTNEQDDAQDVTAKYVDLESNLRNFRAEEAQYLEIMRRSGSIKDTLAVAERLADVRGRIERTQGQLNLLVHQTQMAVLEVTLTTESVTLPVDVRWRPKAQIKAAFWDAADDLSVYANFMIAVFFRLPVFVLWAVTALAFALCGWRLLRWMWGHLSPQPPHGA